MFDKNKKAESETFNSDVFRPSKGSAKVIIGNGTSSKYWERKLLNYFSVEIVEEKGTTFRARNRYWELWPPVFWIYYIHFFKSKIF